MVLKSTIFEERQVLKNLIFWNFLHLKIPKIKKITQITKITKIRFRMPHDDCSGFQVRHCHYSVSIDRKICFWKILHWYVFENVDFSCLFKGYIHHICASICKIPVIVDRLGAIFLLEKTKNDRKRCKWDANAPNPSNMFQRKHF